MHQPLAAVILAAGKGTRMKSILPKVLHEIGGMPMVFHVVKAAEEAGAEKVLVVVGHGSEAVCTSLATKFENAACVEQAEQLGTGHAVRQTESHLKDFQGHVLILMGDAPLVAPDLLQTLTHTHRTEDNTLTVVTAIAPDPTGLGRILRHSDGTVARIVEHKDATEEQRGIHEINTGVYLVRSNVLFDLLAQVKNSNAQGEYLLTDIIELALQKGLKVGTCLAEEPATLTGINSRNQLAEAEHLFQRKKRQAAMANGATLLSPETVFFSHDTVLGQDVFVGQNVRFGAGVTIENNVRIDGNSVFINAHVAQTSHIKDFCHLEGAQVQQGALIGPFARLRPEASIGENAHIGNFVEIKKTTIGKGSKVNHLSYIGDTDMGAGVNIGAGTITCNYDGANKFKTTIADNVFVGSNTCLVAPLTLEEGVTTGAASVITKSIPQGSLAVTRPELKIKANYQRPTKK